MNVLTVCLGNICRSPLAEGILAAKAKDANLKWYVDSAGTSGWHDGEKADRRSREIAKERGLDIEHQRSRKFIAEDFEKFDLILVMDSSNYQNVIKLARSDGDIDKVKILLNYSFPGQNRAVPDPYFEGEFGHVYDLIDAACDKVLEIENIDKF